MKTIAITFCFLISLFGFSQSGDFETLLENGKLEFKKPFAEQDYEFARKNLERAIALEPKNAEAHYFLGYVYSRINSNDGRGMVDMNLDLTIKTSEQFELVNKLTPKYTGEIVALDPYSKLSAEWGSMAMSYFHNDQLDSAKWAFSEGRKRGGFGDFFLSINRNVLDLCTKNAILISSGDNLTIPLWYLQIAENYRPDVTVIDISLLNSIWYPKYLEDQKKIAFGISNPERDTTQFITWTDKRITIETPNKNDFTWLLKYSHYKGYLLRGDLLFLQILRQNKFKNDVYFTTAFMEKDMLSLKNNLNPYILVDRINYDSRPNISCEEYESKILEISACAKKVNKNSFSEMNFIDNIRFDIFGKINDYIKAGKKKEAKKLMTILDTSLNQKDYPYNHEDALKYLDNLKQRIDSEE